MTRNEKQSEEEPKLSDYNSDNSQGADILIQSLYKTPLSIQSTLDQFLLPRDENLLDIYFILINGDVEDQNESCDNPVSTFTKVSTAKSPPS
jgi:hypothetical protein